MFIKLVCDEIHFHQSSSSPPSFSPSLLPSNRSTPGERRVLVLATQLCRPDARCGAPAILTPARITRAPEGRANMYAKTLRSPPLPSLFQSVSSTGRGNNNSARSVFGEGKGCEQIWQANLCFSILFFIPAEYRFVFWGWTLLKPGKLTNANSNL